MDEHQHDQDLIARVSPAERAECEVLVEDFVRREFVVVTRADLHRAAARFEDAGRCKPCRDGITGLLFAAILRERAAALLQ